MDMYKPDGTLMDAFAAFPAVYGETWTAVLADFGELALFHGWIDVGYQVYLNNEPGPDRPTPWTLDEPASLWDFRALDYYASLYHAAGIGDALPLLTGACPLPEVIRGRAAPEVGAQALRFPCCCSWQSP